MLDQGGSTGRMVADISGRAHIALARLCEYVAMMGWSTPWTRLVLFDVYVRSTLTFAAPVWSPVGLGRDLPEEHP